MKSYVLECFTWVFQDFRFMKKNIKNILHEATPQNESS